MINWTKNARFPFKICICKRRGGKHVKYDSVDNCVYSTIDVPVSLSRDRNWASYEKGRKPPWENQGREEKDKRWDETRRDGTRWDEMTQEETSGYNRKRTNQKEEIEKMKRCHVIEVRLRKKTQLKKRKEKIKYIHTREEKWGKHRKSLCTNRIKTREEKRKDIKRINEKGREERKEKCIRSIISQMTEWLKRGGGGGEEGVAEKETNSHEALDFYSI